MERQSEFFQCRSCLSTKIGFAAIEQALLVDKKYTMQDALLFDFGKSDLRAEATPALEKLALALQKNPSMHFEIGGHTDNIGDEASNQALSEQRALSVYKALVTQNVAPEQLAWKGFGKAQPAAPNDTEAGRQKNRRVECRVVD